ncbi:hypothetical protein HRG_003238 [Hirsutella rhossiliensis]|uniref:Uncharacterized protein n=1 Tax=Hirsutella rhossiliensis TaxID=111463 RepID=A0A9P8N1J4_9HYPO|nr:uncharacterized protein HRG_03238 [Hirsutella rhossiliensis]KAH0965222.1 hypothetical protein HRG_03238 [Hirsutella rhossiliensis]
MPAIRRLAVAIIVGLFVGLGLSLAKDAGPCLGAAHRILDHDAEAAHAQGHGFASAIASLVKRQNDGGGSNATSAASAPSAQASSAPASAQSPTPNATPAGSSSNAPAATSSAPGTSKAPVSSASPRAPASSRHANQRYQTRYHARQLPCGPDNLVPGCSRHLGLFHSTAGIFRVFAFCNFGLFHDRGVIRCIVRVHILFFFVIFVIFIIYLYQPQSTSTSSSQTSADEATTTTSDATSRETITTGAVSTSSAIRKTWTTTLGDGGVKVLTSTSWVAVVPSAASSSGNSKDAGLQNAASQNRGAITLAAAAGALVAGFVLA